MARDSKLPSRRRLTLGLISLLSAGAAFAIVFWQNHAEERREMLNAALSQAIHQDNFLEVKRLIKEGADPNVPEFRVAGYESFLNRLVRTLYRIPPPSHGYGDTALTVAAKNEDLELVTALLKRGAAAQIPNGLGFSALTCAVLGKHGYPPPYKPVPPPPKPLREIIRILLEAGTNPNSQNNDSGGTPFMLAIHWQDDEIDRLFLEHGAKWNIKDATGTTALTHAVTCGRVALVRMMLAEGADPNEGKYKDGTGLLAWSALSDNVEVARLLIEAGAKVSAVDGSKRDVLNYAVCANASAEMVKLLLDHGANPLARDEGILTALDQARLRGDQRVIALLEAAARHLGDKEEPGKRHKYY